MTAEESRQLGIKIRCIREAEGLGRAEFAKLLDISKASLVTIERANYAPRASVLLRVAEAFPHYAFWLLTDKVQEEAGHYAPEKKKSGVKRPRSPK